MPLWDNDPIVSETRPAWADDPIADDSPAWMNDPVEGESAPGMNAVRGAGERAADLFGNLLKGEGMVLDAAAQKPGLIKAAMAPLPILGQAVRAIPDQLISAGSRAAGESLGGAGESVTNTSLGYVPTHTWDSVKREFGEGGALSGSAWAEVGKYAFEQGVKSVPDMVAAVAALPAYITSRSVEIGEERAKNKGKQKAELVDALEAMPFAIGSALLERIGAKGISTDVIEAVGKEALQSGFKAVAKQTAKEGGKGLLKEGGTEFIQEGIIEYAGERFGTDAAMSVAEGFERGVAGAVAGGAFGGGVAGGTALATETLKARKKSPEEKDAEAITRITSAPDVDTAIDAAMESLDTASLDEIQDEAHEADLEQQLATQFPETPSNYSENIPATSPIPTSIEVEKPEAEAIQTNSLYKGVDPTRQATVAPAINPTVSPEIAAEAPQNQRLDPERADRGARRAFQMPDEVAGQAHREKMAGVAAKFGLTPSQAEGVSSETAAPVEVDEKLGYYRAKDLMDSIERADKHSQETGEPAFYVEVDWANIGGGNKAKGSNEAFDQEFFVPAAHMLRQEVEATGGDVVPGRIGGDEAGFVIVNVPEDKIRAALNSAAEKTVKIAQDQGMGGIENPKYPGSPERGINLYFGITPILKGKAAREVRMDADRQININKIERNERGNGQTIGTTGAGPSKGQAAGAESRAAEAVGGIPRPAEGQAGQASERGDQGLNVPDTAKAESKADAAIATGATDSGNIGPDGARAEQGVSSGEGGRGARSGDRGQPQDSRTTSAKGQVDEQRDSVQRTQKEAVRERVRPIARNNESDPERTSGVGESDTEARKTSARAAESDLLADLDSGNESETPAKGVSSIRKPKGPPRFFTAKQASDRGYISNVSEITEFNKRIKTMHGQGREFDGESIAELREITKEKANDQEKTGQAAEVSEVRPQSKAGDSLVNSVAKALNKTPEEILAKETKQQRLERELKELEKRQIDRITKGRTRGAGAGGFNRDVDNIKHQIDLKKQEISDLENKSPGKKIENFGEKLEGGRKNRPYTLADDLQEEDFAREPLSKLWPADEYEQYEDPFTAAMAFAARAEVPAKPRVEHKLRRWVETVKSVRGLAKSITSGAKSRDEILALMDSKYALKQFANKIRVLEAIPRDQWARIERVELYPDAFAYLKDGGKEPRPHSSIAIDGKYTNIETADIQRVIEAVKGMLVERVAEDKKMAFEVRGRSGNYFINKTGDREYRRLKEFKTPEDARAFLKDNHADLVKAWDAVKERDNVKEKDLRTDINRPRVGSNWRKGKDITPEKFQETFGFRGGEFGKWVSQGEGAKERQGLLNQAYDAFMDLSTILKIPPKSISLNGTLGIAFGARGHGWASAHFEPGNLVINLTKPRGAGALGHEWFHALDNYFARMRNEGKEGKPVVGRDFQQAYRESNFITYRPEPLMVHESGRSRMTKSALAIAREKNPSSGFYAADKWKSDPNHPMGVRPEVEALWTEVVKALNASPMAKRAAQIDKSPDAYWSQIIERGARSFENYLISRMTQDGYHNDYLANVVGIENFKRNPDRYPYLLPDEVAPIAEAMDNLFGSLETKETDKGVALYSKSSVADGKPSGLPISEVQKIVDDFAASLNSPVKYTVVETQEEAFGDMPERVKGAYYAKDGEIIIVAENAESRADVIKTLRNETLGRYGLDILPNRDEIISKIEQTRDIDAFKKYWTSVDRDYADETDERKAAVVFNRIAEDPMGRMHRIWSEILELIQTGLRKLGMLKAPITKTELRNLAESIADNIRRGEQADAMDEQPTFSKAAKSAQTTTKAFRDWFKGSQVTDENGDPLVVYHQTNKEAEGKIYAEGFKSDSPRARQRDEQVPDGMFFKPDAANISVGSADKNQISQIPVYLSIQNPFVVDSREEIDSAINDDEYTELAFKVRELDRKLADEFDEKWEWLGKQERRGLSDAERVPIDAEWDNFSDDWQARLDSEMPKAAAAARERLTKVLKERGYDGMIINNDVGSFNRKTKTYVAFDSKQIKSATQNKGTFDPSDPNILYSKQKESEFSQENRRLREEHKTLWNKAKQYYRRNFMPGGLLPKDVFQEKIQRDSEIQVVEFDINHLVGSLENIVKSEYGAPFDKLDRQTMLKLNRALVGKIDTDIKPNTLEAIVAMRQYIDSLSRDYVSILQQQQAELEADGSEEAAARAGLIETITNNIGTYAHRSYKAFDDKDWFKKIPDSTLNAARKHFIEQYVEHGETAEDAKRMTEVTLNEIIKNGTAYSSMDAFIRESKLGAKDLTVLKKRKQIAPEIRALLGEYIDPRVNFAKSATKMGRLVWNQRFLDRVRDIGMGSFLFEGRDRPPEATIQIAADGSDVYAPLNGLWTFPEIDQAFKDALAKEKMADWYRVIVQLNGMVKYGKTVLSPTTAARNWQSAMFFALANGHFDMRHMAKSVAGLREYFTNGGDKARLDYLRKLKKLGVVYDTPYAGEMMRLLEESRIDDLMKSKSSTPYKAFKAMNKFATKAYQYGDDFWKIIGFENEKAALIDAGMTEAMAEKEAADRIRNTYPTYSMVGRAINWLRRFPLVGTFVSFPAEIVRTQGNILRYIHKDWTEGRKKLAAKRMAGQAFAAGTIYGLAAISKAMFGVDDEEEEAVRLMAAPWEKNSNLLFTGRDDNGQLQYIDLSFLDPYNYFKRPITAILRDQPWEDSAAGVFVEVLKPFLGTDIAAGAIFEAMANKKDTGSPVYNGFGTPLEITGQIGNHLRKALQPGIVSNLERTWKAMEGERSSSGRAYDLGDELFGWAGWRVRTLEPKTALYYRSFEFADAKTEATKTLTKVLRDPNDVSDGDIRDAYRSAQRQQAEAYREMSLIVNAAKKNGLSDREINTVLKSSNISEKDRMLLMKGKVPPVQLSKQSLTSATRKARAIFDDETAKAIQRRYRTANQMSREK